jgi:hypothetical protein
VKDKLLPSLAILLIVFAFAFVTVFNRAQVLKFETIEEGECLGSCLRPEQPGMVIISQLADVDSPSQGLQLPDDLAEKLHAIDYQKYFVAVLFHGLTGSSVPLVNINPLMITHAREKVTIYAFLSRPSRIMGQIVLSPYRIIKASKGGQWNSEVTFILNVGFKEMDRQTSFVP